MIYPVIVEIKETWINNSIKYQQNILLSLIDNSIYYIFLHIFFYVSFIYFNNLI